MAFNTKKIDFLKMVATMKEPHVRQRFSSVYLIDGKDDDSKIEIYRACTMMEEGIISAMNQSTKFRNWL